MMCAIDEDSSACYGDSGGPLVLANVNGDGPAQPVVQVGIVSWGIYGTRFRFQLYLHLYFCFICRNSHLHTVSLFVGCLNATAPNVYTRISDVADWIKETVCGRSGELCSGRSKSGKSVEGSKAGKGGKSPKLHNECLKSPTWAPTPEWTWPPNTPWPTWPPNTPWPTPVWPTYQPSMAPQVSLVSSPSTLDPQMTSGNGALP